MNNDNYNKSSQPLNHFTFKSWLCVEAFFISRADFFKSKIHYSVHFSSPQTCWCSEKTGLQKETEEALIKKQIAFFSREKRW